ncbi:MAG: hypothetical protein LPD71_03155, partial [Shewanella sp.]|nr:hypothetical protein [Shewanella sp.]
SEPLTCFKSLGYKALLVYSMQIQSRSNWREIKNQAARPEEIDARTIQSFSYRALGAEALGR